MVSILKNHAVIIASLDRSEVLRDTIVSLRQQTKQPHQVIVAVTKPEDIPQDFLSADGIEFILARKGSSTQRNDALCKLSPQIELVSFFDDDVELESSYLQLMNRFFERNAEIVLADGTAVKDGKVSRAEAIKILSSLLPANSSFSYSQGAYGCNMTVRRFVADAVRFDERLRLYAWLEDADFSRRCLAYGRCANFEGACFIHLRATSGRVGGEQFGFAQIMNSYYLRAKGQMSFFSLLRTHWGPALAANLWGSLVGDLGIDRFGRLTGNFVALRLLAQGRCEPEYIERLST